MLKGRTPTKLEKNWIELSLQVPCLACARFAEIVDSPAEYHHMRGKTDPGAHLEGYSLCARHHRIADTHHPKRWVSRHGDGKRLFEARYCMEGQFLVWQREAVEAVKKCQV